MKVVLCREIAQCCGEAHATANTAQPNHDIFLKYYVSTKRPEVIGAVLNKYRAELARKFSRSDLANILSNAGSVLGPKSPKKGAH